MDKSDFCELPDSKEETFIENLKIRFAKNKIYVIRLCRTLYGTIN